MLAVENCQSSSFSIRGDLGADGDGYVRGYSIIVDGYIIFVKQVYGTGDPSVNHIVILPDTGNQ